MSNSGDGKKVCTKAVWLVAAIVSLSIAIGAFVFVLISIRKSNSQISQLESIKDQVVTSISTHSDEPVIVDGEGNDVAFFDSENNEDINELTVDLSVYDFPEIVIDFDELKNVNEDIYAWINIPDTGIDYPILQHPTSLEHYLNYNVDGTKGRPGCIYTELYNSKDFSDFNTVIYGHNWIDGTMFSNLHYYEDSEFFDTHPYIYIFTSNGNMVYRIFAAYDFSNIHLLLGFDLNNEEIRDIYIDNIYEAKGLKNNYNTEIEVTKDDKIITLSTCMNNGNSSKRYLVAGVLIADARIANED